MINYLEKFSNGYFQSIHIDNTIVGSTGVVD